MRVSLNTIKQYTAIDLSIDDLVTKINQQLGGVSDVTDIGATYQGAVIVRVESCEKHSNADKLNVCMVNDGSGELTQVVCGAPNVKAGMLAVWLKPGSIVPSTAGDKEPFVLGARELRGVMSNGMMASPKELGLGDSHDGILEIHESENVVPGMDFAVAFGLDDMAIEIENKMFTHRPDLFGQLGVAREIAGIQGIPFKSPDWYSNASVDTLPVGHETLPLVAFNTAGENTPRFTAIAMTGVTVRPSPTWLQAALVSMGGKPINNVVDLTNYMMLLTAQPTHAYDYAKIRGAKIGSRMAETGESVTLLNGKSYTLENSDIVIADAEGPIGLAGIMGGSNSEVSEDTTSIVIEVANFDMYTLRKSSMRHGVFTDALTRFNKGQSPYQNLKVLRKLVSYMQEIAGGAVASEIYDVGDVHDHEHDNNPRFETGTVTAEFINERLGTELRSQEIAALLANVEFDVNVTDAGIDYRAPFWRTDIIEAEDIVEEIGRLYGFDKLPRRLPKRSTKPAARNERRELKSKIRGILSRAGANEVLTYSFVHEKLLVKSGQSLEHAFKLSNALSPDLQYYRLSLTPSLLDKVSMNYRAGYDLFGLFEIGKTHFKGEMAVDDPDVPNEDEMLSFVLAGDKDRDSAYYGAKRFFEQVVDITKCEMVPMDTLQLDDEWGSQLCAPYEKERSVVIVKDNQIWGVLGEFRTEVKKSFKLPSYAAGFEIHLEAFVLPTKLYKPLSRFPGTSKDISIKVSQDVTYAAVLESVKEVVNQLSDEFYHVVTPVSIYQAEGSSDKTISLRIRLGSSERTMNDVEANAIVDKIVAACINQHSAVIV